MAMPHGLSRTALGLAVMLVGGAGVVSAIGVRVGRADSGLVDPLLGQPAAIDDGKQIYREKCIICHGRAGGRGPDLFAVNLTDQEFLDTVLAGRKDGLMPAFASRLSVNDVWEVRAFVKANPNGM
jgi:mono/diheme cytochrome c family protein